jgi:hypothetical protein
VRSYTDIYLVETAWKDQLTRTLSRTRHSYDANGVLSSSSTEFPAESDQANITWEYAYDVAGQLVGVGVDGFDVMSISYVAGTNERAAVSLNEGDNTSSSWEFERVNRSYSVRHNGALVYQAETDANGRPVRTMLGNTSTITYEYGDDAAGSVVINATDDGGWSERVNFVFDDLGRVHEIQGALWGHLVADYDTLARPRELWARGLSNMTFRYRDSGSISSVEVNSTQARRGVDQFGRIVSVGTTVSLEYDDGEGSGVTSNVASIIIEDGSF